MTVALTAVSTWDPRFVAALRRHYTGSRGAPPGRKLAYAITEDDQLRGWWGLGEPPYKLAARRRIGLADARPAPYTVCDFIFRLERTGPTRASTILRALRERAKVDWARRYGHAPVHWESLVDPAAIQSTVPGACYRRAGYRVLGSTTGRGARRPPGATHGPRVWGPASPKIVLYHGPLPRLQ